MKTDHNPNNQNETTSTFCVYCDSEFSQTEQYLDTIGCVCPKCIANKAYIDPVEDTKEDSTQRTVYTILHTEQDKDGNYIPCIAVEGENGYHRTDWNFGNNIEVAREICEAKNSRMGISPKDAILIVLSSMRQ